MNKITCDFPSDSLKTVARVVVLLPKPQASPFDLKTVPVSRTFPTLYLLHGAFDDGECWLWRTDLADLVDSLGLAVVIPSCQNSFYLDDDGGMGYHTYITEELPSYLGRILPLSPKREENFIGGLSMGGYGSLYAAFMRPEQYSKVFSMSGALDIRMSSDFVKTCGGTLPSCLRNGKPLGGGDYDLMPLAEGAKADRIPQILLTCGEQDPFLGTNRAFFQKAQGNGLNVSLRVTPGGHEWNYWREWLPRCLGWLMGRSIPGAQ